jgi:GT2 family glycosyltransferase
LNTAIVILNYNGVKLLEQFLPAVIRYSQHARIVVADNASTDRSAEFVQREFPQVEVIRLDKNYGFCGGYNRALKQVNAKYYVLLNSDVEVTEGWLQPLVAVLEQDELVVAVQPKILSYHNKDYFEYAGAGGGYLDMLGYPFCRGRLFNFIEKDESQYNDTRPVFWASGACMVIRSSVYHQQGGLDEDFFAHMEEIDLCWKIHRSGKKVVYCGKGSVYHVGAGTLSKSNPLKTYYNFRNGFNLLILHLPGLRLIITAPVRIILDYLAAIKFLASGLPAHSWAVLKAHYHVVTTLLKTFRKRRKLHEKFSFNTRPLYRGSAVFAHYLLGKKRLTVP